MVKKKFGKDLTNKLKDKRCRLREKHAIKTFKMKERMVCINRDRNACLNMRKLVLKYFETGDWLKPYVNTKRYQPPVVQLSSGNCLAPSGIIP